MRGEMRRMMYPCEARESCTGLTVICPKCGKRFTDELADTCYDDVMCYTVGGWEFGETICLHECEAAADSGRDQYAPEDMICECGHRWAAECATFVGEEVPA